MYHIGLSREEIEHVGHLIAKLDAQPPGEDADRRVHPRIDFSHAMWLNLPSEPGAPWVHIFSRNLSTGGLSFLTRKLFYMNQHLVISHELNENTPLLVLAKVCFSRVIEMGGEGGIQEVGLAFGAIEYDPGRERHVPSRWLSTVMQNEWQARKQAVATAAS